MLRVVKQVDLVSARSTVMVINGVLLIITKENFAFTTGDLILAQEIFHKFELCNLFITGGINHCLM